jgi:hypothetical protein
MMVDSGMPHGFLPDWDYWLQHEVVSLYKAIALSCDFDPARLGQAPKNDLSEKDFLSRPEPEEYLRRCLIAKAHASAGLISETVHAQSPYECDVKLRQFVIWAIEQGWDLPPELTLFISPTEPCDDGSTKSVDKPLNQNERNSLLTIIAALCEYSGIDPKERGTATKVEKMTEDLGARVSHDTVKRALDKIPDAVESRMK